MGRTYYVEEAVQKYFAEQKSDLVSGLLIGQCSAQRDYVVFAVRTPPREDQREGAGNRGDRHRLDEIDEEWFCIHAGQVSRMLPGGFLLVGVFLISPPEVSKESPNLLRKLVFATEKSAMKNKLWNPTDEDVSDRVALQICSSTNKILCRTFDVKDPKSTAKPADWKYQNSALSWLTIECNIRVDLPVSLPSSVTYEEQQKRVRAALAQWAQHIEDSTILFNGQLMDKEELKEDQKRGRSGNSARPIISASVLAPSDTFCRRTARVQPCEASLRILGVVKCRGYICNNKPKVRDAVQAIKRDILNTLSDRCDILFEDLSLNRSDNESLCPLPLPQRVCVPIPGSGTALCDYVVGEESAEEVQSRLLELLDREVNFVDLEFVEETGAPSVIVNEEETVTKPPKTASDQKCAATKDVSSSTLPQTIGIAISAAVVVVAILIYLLK